MWRSRILGLGHRNDGISVRSQRLMFLGVEVAVGSIDSMAQWIVDVAEQVPSARLPDYVCVTSVHGLIEATENPRFGGILNDATLVTQDGMPLVWYGRLHSYRSMQRVYGPSLMQRVCELSADREIRHFFYGEAEGVADDLAARMATAYPGD